MHHIAITHPVLAAWVTAARGQDVGVERSWFDQLNAQHAREQANCTEAETRDLLRRNGEAAERVVRGHLATIRTAIGASGAMVGPTALQKGGRVVPIR